MAKGEHISRGRLIYTLDGLARMGESAQKGATRWMPPHPGLDHHRMSQASLIQKLRNRLDGLAPETRFLLAMAGGLLIFLQLFIPLDFTDPIAFDREFAIRPGHPSPADTQAEFEGSWQPGEKSFVPADADARLRILTPAGPWQRLHLTLNGDAAGGWTLRVGRSHSGYLLPAVHPGTPVEVNRDLFAGLLLSEEPIEIALQPRKDGMGHARLTRVAVRLSAMPEPASPHAMTAVLVLPLLPMAVYTFLLHGGRRTRRQAAILGGLAGMVLCAVAVREPVALQVGWVATLSLFLGAGASALLKVFVPTRLPLVFTRQDLLRGASACGLGVLWALAVSTRTRALADARMLTPLPDALDYIQIALDGGLFDTSLPHPPSVREPLFPLLLRIWLAVMPESFSSARFFSMLVGLALVMGVYLAGRRMFSSPVGLIAAGALAANPWLAGLSVSVLRDELFALLILLLIACRPGKDTAPALKIAIWGILGAALCLTRANAILLLVPVTAWEAWRRRLTLAQACAAWLVILLLAGGHYLYNMKIGGGDPLYSSSVHTRYYLNRTLIGQPGFPATMADWEAAPYAGEPAGIGGFLMALGPFQVAANILRGYIRLFLFEFPHGRLFFGFEWAMLPVLPGLYALWRRREAWWGTGVTVLMLAPVALIAPIQLDDRLALPAAPIILYAWIAGASLLAGAVASRFSAQRRPDQEESRPAD